MIGAEISQLIALLAKIPGLGPRSAKRAALHLIKKRDTHLTPLIKAMQEVLDMVEVCPLCGNLDTVSPCAICSDIKRERNKLCIVADIADLWALERAGSFKGKYHVLGGLLSALDGVSPDDLGVEALLDRVKKDEVKEVILALPVTVEGQTTSHYLADMLADFKDVEVYMLAQGIPVGGELDYLDDGTIATAFKAKKKL